MSLARQNRGSKMRRLASFVMCDSRKGRLGCQKQVQCNQWDGWVVEMLPRSLSKCCRGL